MKKALLAILLVGISSSHAFAQECFPQLGISHSPSQTYSIIWQEPTDGQTHHLFFAVGKTRTPFFDFGRSACVVWEPHDQYFALTYHLGSNVSEAYIYQSSGPKKIMDLIDFVPPRVKELYRKNDHSYLEVLSWTDKGILVRVWGHGDFSPEAFEVKVLCSGTIPGLSCVEIGG